MTWLLYALLSALLSAAISSLLKLSKGNLDTAVVSCALALGSFVFSGVLLLLKGAWVPVYDILSVLLLVVFLDYLALLAYVQALRISDISLVSPLAALTPLFILFVGPLILGELPSAYGVVGVMLVVCGSYVMSISNIKDGLLAPMQALFKDSGCLLMLGVAIVWSLTSVYNKVGIQATNPLVWSCIKGAGLGAALLGTCLYKCDNLAAQVDSGWKTLLSIGVLACGADLTMLLALEGSYVVYVIAIKKSSAIFTVLAGAFIFAESNIKERLLGTCLILIGVFVIAAKV